MQAMSEIGFEVQKSMVVEGVHLMKLFRKERYP